MKNSKSSENYKKNCEKKINFKKKILKKNFEKKNYWPSGPIKSVIGPPGR